jgi:maleate isomerase
MTAARIGVLVPAGNPTVEPELYRMAPSSVTLHFARLESPDGTPGAHDGMEHRLLAYLDSLPRVLPTLAAVRPTVVVLAHTSVSYATGFDDESALIERMAKLAGCAAITASRAILAAFAHLGVRRIALATPYSEAVEALGATYWKAAGLAVVAHRRLDGVTNIYEETEGRAYELGRQTDMRDAQALLISGTGLPTAGIVQRLEDELGKPVVTGQTAALWHALRVAGIATRVSGYGRLLAAG